MDLPQVQIQVSPTAADGILGSHLGLDSWGTSSEEIHGLMPGKIHFRASVGTSADPRSNHRKAGPSDMHQSMPPLRATRRKYTSIVVRCAPRHPGAVAAHHGIGGQREGEIAWLNCDASRALPAPEHSTPRKFCRGVCVLQEADGIEAEYRFAGFVVRDRYPSERRRVPLQLRFLDLRADGGRSSRVRGDRNETPVPHFGLALLPRIGLCCSVAYPS